MPNDEAAQIAQLREQTIKDLQKLLTLWTEQCDACHTLVELWTQERDACNERIAAITKQLSDLQNRLLK